MSQVKGRKEFNKFKNGEKLTRKQAMAALCYDCISGSTEDCLSDCCPIFEYRLNKGK